MLLIDWLLHVVVMLVTRSSSTVDTVCMSLCRVQRRILLGVFRAAKDAFGVWCTRRFHTVSQRKQ